MKQLLLAEFVAPMDAGVIRDGAILIDSGVIVDVGNGNELREKYPQAVADDLGAAVIVPGLVNAHTHLELSCLSPGDRPDSFCGWILSLQQRMLSVSRDPLKIAQLGVDEGIRQCLRYGVTTVGDISQQYHITRPRLAKSQLNVVSYGEAVGLAQRRNRFDELLDGAVQTDLAGAHLRIGVSPHAPYTVDARGYRQALQLAKARKLPLATHLAETSEEAEFLQHQSGPFRQLWQRMGWWQDGVELVKRPPIAAARTLGLLDYPTVLAHVNYCSDDDLVILAHGQASVVYCPRTHRYFGHPPHRWRQMLENKINVVVGTDSCASSPNLNLLDDLRLVHALDPQFSVQRLWQMITLQSAQALQWSAQTGSLTAGKFADLVIFKVQTDDPLRELLENDQEPARVMVAGQWVDNQK